MKQRGFTLIELILTISVMGILALISVQFVKSSAQGFVSSAGRQQLASAGYVVNEQISRAIRDALPGSVRTTSDGLCIEYIPVKVASSYTDLQVGVSITQFSAVPYSATTAVSGYVSVYPVGSVNVYAQNDPGPLTPDQGSIPAGTAELTVTLASAHTFPSDSPERRFFIVDAPEAICQDGAYLYRYRNYGFISNVANLKASLPVNRAGGRSVLAYPLETNSLAFRYQNPTLARNGLVVFEYTLLHPTTSESLKLSQQVRVANVP
ncbi:MAG: type II secretion system protein [Thalassolituus sp.]